MSRPRRPPPADVHGVVLVDKPRGPTSFDVVKRVRHLFNVKSAGHTGTLDPMATGLLPVCLGDATRIATFVTGDAKEYVGTVRFGATTDTLDADGTVLDTKDPSALDERSVRGAVEGLVGTIALPPPMYSARKVDGKRLYELAREGVEVEREAREVTIVEAALLAWQPPDAVVRILASKGTYIRSLADHLGRLLGPGAHLAALRRTKVGVLQVGDATALDALESMAPSDRLAKVLPVEHVLAAMPAIHLDTRAAASVAYGNALKPGFVAVSVEGTLVAGTHARLLDPERLVVAVGLVGEDGGVTLARVLRARTGPGPAQKPGDAPK